MRLSAQDKFSPKHSFALYFFLAFKFGKLVADAKQSMVKVKKLGPH